MRKIPFLLILVIFSAAGLPGCRDEPAQPQLQVIAEGLLNPVGVAQLPDGGLLIAEEGTGERDNSAGVSLITADGNIGRLVSDLPSSRDSGDLSGVPLVAVSPAGDVLYLSHFNAGQLYTLPLQPEEPLGLPSTPYGVADLTPAMTPLNRVQLINPFDMAFDAAGAPIVSDASANGVAKENPDGTTRFFHQFFELPDPANEKLKIDPVPTGITRVEEEYYVTLTGGCPYPAGRGRLVAIDEERNERVLLSGLNMPIDVAQGPDGVMWLLEFAEFTADASCFDGQGYQPHSGRLSLLGPDGELTPVLTELNFPGAATPLPDGRIIISEVFGGRVLAFTPGTDDAAWPVSAANLESDEATLRPAPVPRATFTPRPPPTPAPPPPWHFANVATEVGLDFRHGAFQEGLYADPAAMMGAGLCWLDYDRDGWLDLYLVNSYANEELALWETEAERPRNALYRNDAGHFSDVSGASGADLNMRGNGCVAADFNRDGWPDIFVTADGANALLLNTGDGAFQEQAAPAGVAAGATGDAEWNSAAVVGDLNADGWPDLFVGAYIDMANMIPNPSGSFPQDFYGLPDSLYLNEGLDQDGQLAFRDVAVEAGLLREERALGALLTDLDADGDLDLYIANDGQPNRLYENQSWPGGAAEDPAGLGFRFADLTDSTDLGDSGSGMGVVGGDYDGDGLVDLLVTNWDTELNALYRNQTAEAGELAFRYSTYRIGMAGLGENLTGWGAGWADLDQDSDLDLLVVNGHVPIGDLAADAQLVRLYGNRLAEGDPGQFRDWTEIAGLTDVGPLMARGGALADFDNDGDLDVAINTIGGQAALLRNERPAGNWLAISLDGFFPGAQVVVTLPDGRRLLREWYAGDSYLSSGDPRLHFGLGDAEIVPELTVRWPDGTRATWQDVAVNQYVRVSAPNHQSADSD